MFFYKTDKRTVVFDNPSQQRNIDVEDGARIDHLVLDKVESEGSSLKFCIFTTLPRYEVVFSFQAFVLILILTSFYNLVFFDVPCEDMSFWVSVLSGGVG